MRIAPTVGLAGEVAERGGEEEEEEEEEKRKIA